MSKTVPVKVTASIVAGAAVLAIFLVFGIPVQSTQAADAPPAIELTQDILQERTKFATEAALAHPQVKAIIDNAERYAADYHMLDSGDHVTISTWGSKSVEGSWQDGYSIALRGGKIIEVDVDRQTNTVLNVQITNRPDKTVPITFTDNQKRAIEISLTDPQIQSFAANNEFYVSLVRDYGNVQFRDRDCGFDECAIVQFTSLTQTGGANTIVNTKTGAIHYVSVVNG